MAPDYVPQSFPRSARSITPSLPLPCASRGEWLAISILFLVFMIANLLTAPLSPRVWTDEVYFTDPAYFLASGHGFTSTAWQQPSGQFFAGNVPLYSVMLAGWIRVFGFNPTSVRSFGYVTIVLFVGLLWWGARRFDLIRSSKLRVYMAAVLLCGHEIGVSYRSARYDMLGALWCVIGFLGFLHPKPIVRYITAFAVGLLLPITGLQLIAYSAIMCLIALFFSSRRRAIPFALTLAAGGAISLASLLAIYHATGVDHYFSSMVLHLSATGTSNTEAHGLLTKIPAIITVPFQQHTLVIETLLLVFIYIIARRRGLAHWRSPLGFGFAVSLAVPATLCALYVFPRYYGWMVNVPVTVALIAALDQIPLPLLSRTLTILGLAFVLMIGLPLRLALALNDYPARAYPPVDAFVTRNLSQTDHVAIDDGAFYPARRIAAECICQDHIHALRDDERAAVNVLIICPEHLSSFQDAIGGKWRMVDELPVPGRPTRKLLGYGSDSNAYHLIVFRRVS